MGNTKASSGHKLGQLIGDWYEEYFVLPLLTEVADSLKMFVDSRFIDRKRLIGKTLWDDLDGNSVDYDYVLELDGTTSRLGVPVAFIECFWRRGSRHSKDKARDDSGKLLPMRDAYATARFLGIVAAGDFTGPARDLVRSRDIDLFYIPKEKIVHSFASCGLVVDYPDKTIESEKATIVEVFCKDFSDQKKKDVRNALLVRVGDAAIRSYVDRVRARLSASPQEIRFVLRHDSNPKVFESVEDASEFLLSPNLKMDDPTERYLYQVTYSDGTEFERLVDEVENLRELHSKIVHLADHMTRLAKAR